MHYSDLRDYPDDPAKFHALLAQSVPLFKMAHVNRNQQENDFLLSVLKEIPLFNQYLETKRDKYEALIHSNPQLQMFSWI